MKFNSKEYIEFKKKLFINKEKLKSNRVAVVSTSATLKVTLADLLFKKAS